MGESVLRNLHTDLFAGRPCFEEHGNLFGHPLSGDQEGTLYVMTCRLFSTENFGSATQACTMGNNARITYLLPQEYDERGTEQQSLLPGPSKKSPLQAPRWVLALRASGGPKWPSTTLFLRNHGNSQSRDVAAWRGLVSPWAPR